MKTRVLRCFRKVVTSNIWHSVEVRVRKVHPADGGGREIRMAADQDDRTNATYLTTRAARQLARVLVRAAKSVEVEAKRKAKR